MNLKFEEVQCTNMTDHKAHPWKDKDVLLTCHGVDSTADLLGSRREVYGDRIENMENTAKIWSGFLRHEIQAWQVPVMMALYKIYRMSHAHDYSDNIDDAKGWLKMFEEIVGDDMVMARTVEEYLEQKNKGSQVDGHTIEDWAAKLTAHNLKKMNDASEEYYAEHGGIIPQFMSEKIEKHIASLNEQIIATAPEGIVYSGGPDTQAPIDWQGPMDQLDNLIKVRLEDE